METCKACGTTRPNAHAANCPYHEGDEGTRTKAGNQVVLPIATPCSTFEAGRQCREVATHWLVCPEGNLNPGGHVCEKHGRAITKEFQEKIGEVWTLIPIVGVGR